MGRNVNQQENQQEQVADASAALLDHDTHAEQDNAEQDNAATTEASELAALDQFGAAWRDAIGAADPTTGAVPAVNLDAVKVAWGKLSRKQRNASPHVDAQQETMAAAMADPTTPNVGAMVAASALVKACAEKQVKTTAERVVLTPAEFARDSMPDALYLAAIVLEAIRDGNEVMPFAAVSALALAKRLSGARVSSGVRLPIAKLISDVLADAEVGATFTVAEMAAAIAENTGEDVNAPSVDDVWKRDADKLAKLHAAAVMVKSGNREVRAFERI